MMTTENYATLMNGDYWTTSYFVTWTIWPQDISMDMQLRQTFMISDLWEQRTLHL